MNSVKGGFHLDLSLHPALFIYFLHSMCLHFTLFNVAPLFLLLLHTMAQARNKANE